MPIMKEGRQPLAKITPDDSDKALGRIEHAMNEMISRHDYPEDVALIVNNYIRNWVANWKKQGVSKSKYSFEEFANSGIAGFNGNLRNARMNALKRSRGTDKILAPGKSD
jgi:hypothetical protein|tara:strand:+ start:884 stop:1213 length:330 start_codon:yes stop_codon:yes gene_type:complete